MSKKSEAVIQWRRNTKKRIIEAFGNKCGGCGYDKCQEAMELHHLSPNEKEFGFGATRANPKSWKKLVPELRKCVLLCCLCHREYHAGIRILPLNIKRFDESYADYQEVNRQNRLSGKMDECPICKKEKLIWNSTCSYKCAAKMARKYNWDAIDLYNLYIVRKMSQNAIAKIIGCSDVAVRKRLIKLGLRSP